LKIGARAIKRWAHLGVAVLAFIAIYPRLERFFPRVPFPMLVLAAGLAGLAGARFFPKVFEQAGNAVATKRTGQGEDAGHEDARDSRGAYVETVIDDHAPPPAHTLPSRRRALRTLCFGLALWALPFAALVAWRGWGGLHAQEYRFFTKAALVTFGGAYAVLAYVTQAAVGSYGWLTHTQAVDGLALAETTPGPLIMVLQFVGFMAGWNHPEGLSPAMSAVVGALITSYTTFLPCFIFIFIGAPYVEVLRGNRLLQGALAGITAAVVGVILSLALVFGWAVIFGAGGLTSGADWFAALMSIAAFVALYRFKADVLWVVVAGGCIGLARSLFVDFGF
jgi:chromate transporter